MPRSHEAYFVAIDDNLGSGPSPVVSPAPSPAPATNPPGWEPDATSGPIEQVTVTDWPVYEALGPGEESDDDDPWIEFDERLDAFLARDIDLAREMDRWVEDRGASWSTAAKRVDVLLARTKALKRSIEQLCAREQKLPKA